MDDFIHVADPVAWSRPRFGLGRGFNTPEHTAAKSDLAWQLKKWWAKPFIPMPKAVHVELTFEFKTAKKKLYGYPKPTRSDVDNHIKMVLDAGNGVLWQDDSQVTSINAIKIYGAQGLTRLSIRTLENQGATGL